MKGTKIIKQGQNADRCPYSCPMEAHLLAPKGGFPSTHFFFLHVHCMRLPPTYTMSLCTSNQKGCLAFCALVVWLVSRGSVTVFSFFVQESPRKIGFGDSTRLLLLMSKLSRLLLAQDSTRGDTLQMETGTELSQVQCTGGFSCRHMAAAKNGSTNQH